MSESDLAHQPLFSVISGAQVDHVLRGREKSVIELVEQAYLLHGAGRTVNPPSYFLRFPDRPTARIIALPASLGGGEPVDGIKWISSFPDNVASGLPRASAVLILNDPATGYPLACLESSIISAGRTAASAALAASVLSAQRPGGRATRIGYVGTGLIARYVHTYLLGAGWQFDRVGVHDLLPEHAEGFRGYLQRAVPGQITTAYQSADELISDCDLVVFATVASTPHVHDLSAFAHAPLVLHLSLRDLAPEVILGSANVVDDIEHCLKADTSVHLTEQQVGNRDFIAGTLPEVLSGALRPPTDRPLVFSPFGLGVLDLAVARFVYHGLLESGDLTFVDGFFHDLSRYGEPESAAVAADASEPAA